MTIGELKEKYKDVYTCVLYKNKNLLCACSRYSEIIYYDNDLEVESFLVLDYADFNKDYLCKISQSSRELITSTSSHILVCIISRPNWHNNLDAYILGAYAMCKDMGLDVDVIIEGAYDGCDIKYVYTDSYDNITSIITDNTFEHLERIINSEQQGIYWTYDRYKKALIWAPAQYIEYEDMDEQSYLDTQKYKTEIYDLCSKINGKISLSKKQFEKKLQMLIDSGIDREKATSLLNGILYT